MSDTTFTKVATVRNTLAMFALFVEFNAMVLPNAKAQLEAYSAGVGPLDLCIGYSAQKAASMLGAYGSDGRRLYTFLEQTVDVLYPFIYGLAFAFLLVRLRGPVHIGLRCLRYAYWLPLATAMADYMENATIVTMLAQYPNVSVSVVVIGNICTLAKWGLFSVTILATGVLATTWLTRRVAR